MVILYTNSYLMCPSFYLSYLQCKRELRDYLNKQAEISKNGGSSGGGGGAGGAGTKPKGSGEDVSSMGVFLLFFVHHEVGIQKLTHPYYSS